MAERWRELAGGVGAIEPGLRNSITDVPGVLVGHARAASGERTGVSVVAPPSLPALAGVATINGYGELTGKLQIEERGLLRTPIYLCGTNAVGAVMRAAVLASEAPPEKVIVPVVGECDDSEMADSLTVAAGDVEAAREALGAEVEEGSVGAGTGMTCFGYPGGIGTASRTVGDHSVGVLLLCNFGSREYLDVPGMRFGPVPERPAPQGSCIAVCATDGPLSAQQLRRLALRPLLGLARIGSYAADGSGEIGLAFSTSADGSLRNRELDPYFAAAYEAAWESVLNCLVSARPAQRRDGTMPDAFPIEEVRRANARG